MSGDQTFYADLRQLRQWFRNTAPGGERAIYAVGPALDPNAEVVKQVIAWRESGDVVTQLSGGPHPARKSGGSLHSRRAGQHDRGADVCRRRSCRAAYAALPQLQRIGGYAGPA